MSLEDWYSELSPAEAACPQELFQRVLAAARQMGFDYCAFGMRLPFPLTRPLVHMFNNYPDSWRERYESQGYLATDPSVAYALQSTTPTAWSEEMFRDTPMLWSEARDVGLRHGWLQSTVETCGVAGMLTLARSSEAISACELKSIGTKLSWLAHVVHHVFAKALVAQHGPSVEARLTTREIEILRWTADGKTAGQISDILTISDNTVNFHIKNAMAKLRTSNKTSAAVRAAMMGILA